MAGGMLDSRWIFLAASICHSAAIDGRSDADKRRSLCDWLTRRHLKSPWKGQWEWEWKQKGKLVIPRATRKPGLVGTNWPFLPSPKKEKKLIRLPW